MVENSAPPKTRGRYMQLLTSPKSGEVIGWGNEDGYITTVNGEISQSHFINRHGSLQINKTHILREYAWKEIFE
jgi:hypothetical protein